MNLRKLHLPFFVLLTVAFCLTTVGETNAAWFDVVVTTEAQREVIRAQPLLQRPNRPGHVYGNTVRRVHHFRHGR
ncbi:hypothetical protein LOC68_15045 [Blastopirellula sp. JC732]|uniref:Secreted protein n=1 Tax=Blastopirellula sediminis TaxID=2894196 RepID=A0A9X1MM76_9BACT|nr:hypothetical protein [Blastopirellula sediminis]MCC9606997.1 hypothetical protein [Blastopirellula sediminis]MCC9629708.1 hypothetical protein [Blastopirellula sediminis]